MGWSGASVTDLGASGVVGLFFIFFCIYRILYFVLTIAGQMRSSVSTTSDADQV